MEKVYEELEEAKAEIKKLKAECQRKAECSESLKRVQHEQLIKLQEANEMTQKQTQELEGKVEEEKRKVEDRLKWKIEQFEHLEEAHEKLRDQFCCSQSEWEKEKSLLVEEISTLQTGLDSQIKISEGLKNKLEMCNQALSHEQSQRKNLDLQISEMKSCLQNVSAECEEAKSRIECLCVERDGEISALRYSLRTKETLCKEMEYKARKLEEENSELVNSLKELQEAQIYKASPPSSLAKLRNKVKALEQAHRDCCSNLRAKEAEWSCQQQKMTQELNDCYSKLKIKDEFMIELKNELEVCHSTATQLKLQNEELSLMLQLLRSEFSEAQMHGKEKAETDSNDKEKDSKISLLVEELEMKSSELLKAQNEIEKEREKAASLLQRIEDSCSAGGKQLLMQEEFHRNKEVLEESSMHQLYLEEEDAATERKLEREHQGVCDALERTNSELTEKIYEVSEIGFELQLWKTYAERLQIQLDENRVVLREIEASLLAEAQIVELLKREIDSLNKEAEEDRRMNDLQQQIVPLHRQIKENLGDENLRENNERFLLSKNDLYLLKENTNLQLTSLTKSSETILDERSAFRELN